MQTSRIYARCGVIRTFQCRSFSKQAAPPGVGSFAVSCASRGVRGGRNSLFALRDGRQLLVPLEWRRHFSLYGGDDDGFVDPPSKKKKLFPSRVDRNRDPNNKNKENYAKKFLEPAARGELGHKHHIPKLAGRPPKANLVLDKPKQGRRWELKTEDLRSSEEEISDEELTSAEGQAKAREMPQTRDNQPIFDAKAFKEGKLPEFMLRAKNDPYFALDELWNDKKYFWNEEDHDNYIPKDFDVDKIFDDEDGDCPIEWTDDDLKERPHQWIEDDIDPKKYFGLPDDFDLEGAIAGTFDLEKYAREKEAEVAASGKNLEKENDTGNSLKGDFDEEMGEYEPPGSKKEQSDPLTVYFEESTDMFELVKKPIDSFPTEEDPDVAQYQIDKEHVMTLQQPVGDGSVEEYIEALYEHPTDYARITYFPLHPNQRREPLPMLLPNFGLIQQPSLDFVEAHVRYLYVTNLPPLTVNGEVGDISNPVHRSSLEQQVARLLDVDSTQVTAANSTSAFVGFHSPRDLANALEAGPLERTLVHNPMAQKYDGAMFTEKSDSLTSFVDTATSADCIVCLTSLPLNCSVESLAATLLPGGTELRKKYGVLTAKDVLIPSEGTALVRFSSAETAASLLGDSLFEARLEKMGVYTIHYLRARRELLHAGFDSCDDQQELREYGPRLVIDGLHTPSKDFWLSNASAVHIRDLDPTITEDQLTKIFQRFSKRLRFNSSVEFVRCELSDQPILGAAYVGFEEIGEARACREALAGVDMTVDEEPALMKIGNRVASLFGMTDREVPGFKTTPEVRTTRAVAELEDDMYNWQKYVDPADIEWLDKHGAPRVIIDETLRGIRRRNPYFGAYDSGFRDEQIEPDMEQGQLYRELVVEYIKILKETAATRENPGDGFWDEVFPGEEPDYSIFDEWDKKKLEIDAVYLKYMDTK